MQVVICHIILPFSFATNSTKPTQDSFIYAQQVAVVQLAAFKSSLKFLAAVSRQLSCAKRMQLRVLFSEFLFH